MEPTTNDWLPAALRALTFLLSIFAALVASQVYALGRSGALARVWRLFILGALVFAAWSLAAFADTFFGYLFEEGRTIALVMDVLQAVFILLLAAGFWLLRQAYYRPERLRPSRESEEFEGFSPPVAAPAPPAAAADQGDA
jgi:hypothetical protein